MKKVAYLVAFVATLSACDIKEREDFEVETIDGRILTLSCSVLDEFSLIYEGPCIVLGVRGI
jgi:hypothetical protein